MANRQNHETLHTLIVVANHIDEMRIKGKPLEDIEKYLDSYILEHKEVRNINKIHPAILSIIREE